MAGYSWVRWVQKLRTENEWRVNWSTERDWSGQSWN